MADEDQVSAGHCPLRLSTDQPVDDYVARRFVVTGRSVSNVSAEPVAEPQPYLPPSAAARVAPHPSGSSGGLAKDLVVHALEIAMDGDRQLTDADRLVLSAAAALLAQVSRRIESRLKPAAARQPAKRKRSR